MVERRPVAVVVGHIAKLVEAAVLRAAQRGRPGGIEVVDELDQAPGQLLGLRDHLVVAEEHLVPVLHATMLGWLRLTRIISVIARRQLSSNSVRLASCGG
nr:hypothetical protein [Nonomuraea basaltis]